MVNGRYKVYYSAGLVVLISSALVSYLIFAETFPISIFFLFFLILILALGSFIYVLWRVRKKEKSLESLNDEFRKAYLDSQEYTGLCSMNRTLRNELSRMLLEIFEHASLEGRSLQELTGGDLENYLKEFIEASGGRQTFLYQLSYSTFFFVIYLLFMKLYMVLRHGFEEPLDMGITLSYALISYVFLPWLMSVNRKASANQWSGSKKLLVLLPFSIPFGLVGMLIFIENQSLRDFLDIPVPLMQRPLGIILVVLVGIATLLFMVREKKLALRKL